MSNLIGCYAKLDRALDQITRFGHDLVEFESKSYKVLRVDDEQDGLIAYKFDQVEEPPILLSIIAGEILHNLRSALDHLVCRIVDLQGQHDKQAFPICQDQQKFNKIRRSALKDVPSHLVTQIESLQPFNSSNPIVHPLTSLVNLSNADKHRIISRLDNVAWHPGRLSPLPQNVKVHRTGKFSSIEPGSLLVEYQVLDGTNPKEIQIDIEPQVDLFFPVESPSTGSIKLLPSWKTLYEIHKFISEEVFSKNGLIKDFP